MQNISSKRFPVPRTVVAIAIGGVIFSPLLAATQMAAAQRRSAPSERSAAPANVPATEAKTAAQPSAEQSASAAGSWSSQCVSATRSAQPECMVEQNAIISNTGQLVASITIRVQAGSQTPVMTVQVPVGLFVPAGITLQVDDHKSETLPIQTCDLKGCFGAQQVDADRLAAMKSGKRLTVAFQNLARRTISIPFVLTSFADSYQKIL